MKGFVAVLAVVAVFVSAGCGGRTTSTTPDAMYKSIAEFYSIVYDREDLTAGEFTLWPRRGSKVAFEAPIETIDVKSWVAKDLSFDRDKVTLTKKYSVHLSLAPARHSIRYYSKELGREVMIPHRFRIVIKQSVDEKSGGFLRGVKPGDTIAVRGTVSGPSPVDELSFFNPFYQFGEFEVLLREFEEFQQAAQLAAENGEIFSISRELEDKLVRELDTRAEAYAKRDAGDLRLWRHYHGELQRYLLGLRDGLPFVITVEAERIGRPTGR